MTAGALTPQQLRALAGLTVGAPAVDRFSDGMDHACARLRGILDFVPAAVVHDAVSAWIAEGPDRDSDDYEAGYLNVQERAGLILGGHPGEIAAHAADADAAAKPLRTVVRVLGFEDGHPAIVGGGVPGDFHAAGVREEPNLWVFVLVWSARRAFLTGAAPFFAAGHTVRPEELVGRRFFADLPVYAPGNTATAGEYLRWPGLVLAPRLSTPDEELPGGGHRLTAKRHCNGCGRDIGDATRAELAAATRGDPLPDVTAECGCATAAEPA